MMKEHSHDSATLYRLEENISQLLHKDHTNVAISLMRCTGSESLSQEFPFMPRPFYSSTQT